MPELVLPSTSEPLFEPSRIKVIHGGTGAGKTQAAARVLLATAATRKVFIVCLVEEQATIEDSAMRLLTGLVEEFDLTDMFVRAKVSLTGANGSEFVFEQVSRCGRMLEQADIVWVEDGQNVSSKSWDAILRGARKAGSEVWVTMNPGAGNGVAHSRFFKDSIYAPMFLSMNFRTNQHFPESMEVERQRMLREDPVEYQHLWEGVPIDFVDNTPTTIVGDDGTVEEIAPDSPMAVLRRISTDRGENVSSRIEAARALLPYVHKKQPVAIEGLGAAAGVVGAFTPERMKALSDGDIERMLAMLGQQFNGQIIDVPPT